MIACVYLIIEFSWRLDVWREGGPECPDKRIEVAILALCLVYALLHIYVLFYNAKVTNFNFQIFQEKLLKI